jgi:hypothetical protein
MVGVCAGFRPGSSALTTEGMPIIEPHTVARAPALADVDDQIGWHDRGPLPPVAMRRARRIDVWMESGAIHIDAMFRDTANDPGGIEVVQHEYQIEAVADATTGRLVRVVAEPRVLPYPECPTAAGNAGRLVGEPLDTLRSTVLERLRATDCCTHLNDALRSLADVPALVTSLAA